MVEIEEDVTGLGQGVNFLFDEQIIQDERLLNLETETEEIDEQLVLINDDLESMFLEFLNFSRMVRQGCNVCINLLK